MAPEQPKYKYEYKGLGVLNKISHAVVDNPGIPNSNVKVIIPQLWNFHGVWVSETPLTDDQVRGKIPSPYEGFMVADARKVKVSLIDAPLPEYPEKPRPKNKF